MKEYLDERKKQERISKVTGTAFTVAAHVLVLLFVSFTGMKEVYPKPQDQNVVIEFEDIPEPLEQALTQGEEPRAEQADPKEEVNLVQKSESNVTGHKPNVAKESTVGKTGDVEVPEPKREEEINQKSLFHSANNKAKKDTLAPQTSSKPSDSIKEGHPDGNTTDGQTSGTPNARLQGRQVDKLRTPAVKTQAQGTVVINIVVDASGKVISAQVGSGTTISDSAVQAAAKTAALGSTFSVGGEGTPPTQQGTITYNFKLK